MRAMALTIGPAHFLQAFTRRGVMWGAVWGEGDRVTLTFTSHVEIIFGLMAVSYIADLTKHAVMLHGYGR